MKALSPAIGTSARLAADDDVLIEGVALSPDDVRRRGLPVVAAAAAAAAPMDRKGV